MLVLRPILNSDFDALKQVAIESGHGFTSLPVCDDLLEDKISRSVASFERDITSPRDEGYLFVLGRYKYGRNRWHNGYRSGSGYVSSTLSFSFRENSPSLARIKRLQHC